MRTKGMSRKKLGERECEGEEFDGEEGFFSFFLSFFLSFFNNFFQFSNHQSINRPPPSSKKQTFFDSPIDKEDHFVPFISHPNFRSAFGGGGKRMYLSLSCFTSMRRGK